MAERDCTCAQCGSGYLADSRKRYCSDSCKWKAADARRPNRGPKPHAIRGPFVCSHCRSEYRTRRPIGEGERYCSRECSFSAMKNGGASDRQIQALKASTVMRSEIAALARIRAAWLHGSTDYADCKDCGKRYRKRANKARCIRCVNGLTARIRPCTHCGLSFEQARRWQRLCSEWCAQAAKKAAAAKGRSKLRATDQGKAKRRAEKNRYKSLRRSRVGASGESIDPIAVFERDGWRCHICKQRTPKKLRGSTEDRAPELDHIITLFDGGSHTWANVACACRQCNGEKGARSLGQLNLGWAA